VGISYRVQRLIVPKRSCDDFAGSGPLNTATALRWFTSLTVWVDNAEGDYNPLFIRDVLRIVQKKTLKGPNETNQLDSASLTL